MNKRDAQKLQIGDKIRLKHNLGSGPITKIILEYSKGCGQPSECRFPMIQYCQDFTKQLTWCTYLVIEYSHRPLKVVGGPDWGHGPCGKHEEDN